MFNTASINSTLLSTIRINSIYPVRYAHYTCKILVVGGGTGGCSMAAKLSRKFNKAPNHVIVIEPSDVHYYQPLFTLIGPGITKLNSCKKAMKDVLPKKAQWLKHAVELFKPNENMVKTSNGDTVQYEHMIVAMGFELYWDKVPGLVEGLKDPNSQVCSIYGPDTVTKVFDKIKNTKPGNALFTLPNTPVKCAGAPLKIACLSEDYWRRKNRRNSINVIYNSSLPLLFGVKKYADALWDVCCKRDIRVNLHTNLIEIRPDKKEAVFQDITRPEKKFTMTYSMIHVTPPMGPPEVLKNHKILTDEAGFLDVNPKTLQHHRFENIYGIGDCTSTPNAKTMAAIASQTKALYPNILRNIEGKEMEEEYTGYAACPLVTGPGKCILAEFDYGLQPRETFPVNQAKERYSMYLLKKYFFPFLYWNFILKGHWNGPENLRKIFSVIKTNDEVPDTVQNNKLEHEICKLKK